MAEITSFDLNLSSILAVGETRRFYITGGERAAFRLEIQNEDSYYYNFITNLFQAAKSGLDDVLSSSKYSGSINFPAVTDDDHYDIKLFAKLGTTHSQYNEVRFGDGSIDINSSTGSNSLLLTKIIYQYTALTLTLNPFSPTGAISGTAANDTISVSSGEGVDSQSFSIKFTVANNKALRIIKQPSHTDILAFIEPEIGSAPIAIPGENIYPTATAAFTGDDINGAVTSGVVVRMDNTDLSAVIKVGDKITTPVTTDTVDGIVESGVKVVMDNNVALKMAIGDQVTGNAYLDANIVTVAALNPDEDNAKEFALSEAVELADGITLSFSSKINRSLTTVTAVETSSTDAVNGARDASGVAVTMDSAVATKMAVGDIVTGNTALDAGVFTVASLDNTNIFSLSSAVAIADDTILTFRTATDFTMSQAIQFRDNAPLTFFNQANYRWKITNRADLIKPGMAIVTNSANLTADTTVADYLDTTTIFADTEYEKKLVNVSLPAIDTLGAKPVITNGLVISQAGSVIFDKQQKLALAGDALIIGGYGLEEVKRISGWEVLFTDLKVVLSPISTTTTAVVSNSTSVPVTSRNGILDDVSVVSGVGINSVLALPTVDTGAGAVSGAGTLVLTAAQTLEAGALLTFSGAGQTATITGFVEIIKSGTASNVISIDAEKLLSIT